MSTQCSTIANKSVEGNFVASTCPAWCRLSLLVVLLLLSGCADHAASGIGEQYTVIAKAAATAPRVRAMTPAFVLSEAQKPFNRIGQVRATGSSRAAAIVIDPETPVIYADTRSFATIKGIYTNLIYRIHFSEQPYSLLPFHFGAGKHVGLLVILTMDVHHQVLLVTTASTCGCYAMTIPTRQLSVAAYPDNWPTRPLAVYGERLPAELPRIGEKDILQVLIRPEVHRVMDLQVVSRQSLATASVRTAEVFGLETLKKLPLEDGGSTSLYYSDWPLAGHVKGAIKPWESLLLSLVSLDAFVGMDKDYGDTEESGNPFYTSLQPWNRSTSDMNDFAVYLHYNGWKL